MTQLPYELAVWWVEKYMRLSRDLKTTWFSLIVIKIKQQLEHQPAVKWNQDKKM